MATPSPISNLASLPQLRTPPTAPTRGDPTEPSLAVVQEAAARDARLAHEQRERERELRGVDEQRAREEQELVRLEQQHVAGFNAAADVLRGRAIRRAAKGGVAGAATLFAAWVLYQLLR
jgi:hypothetical protein